MKRNDRKEIHNDINSFKKNLKILKTIKDNDKNY